MSVAQVQGKPFSWSKADKKIAQKAIESGLTYTKTAEIFGVSRNSIASLCHRYIWRKQQEWDENSPLAAEFEDRKNGIIKEEPPEEPPIGISFEDMNKDNCHYFIGTKDNFGLPNVCGRPTTRGTPYCIEHAKVIYKPKPKPKAAKKLTVFNKPIKIKAFL